MFRFDHYTSETIHQAIKEKKNVIIPLGAIEAHSAHLPLSTDNDIAEGYIGELAKRSNSLYLPVLPYGQVWSLQHAPGSIHIQENHLIALLVDILESLHAQGVPMVTFISTHFGNLNAAKSAARAVYERIPLKVLYLTYPGIHEAKKVFERVSQHDLYLHADEVETSFMLHFCPDKVNLDRVQPGLLVLPEEASYQPMRWTEFSTTYILGDATLATEEKGRKAMEIILRHGVELIEREKMKLTGGETCNT